MSSLEVAKNIIKTILANGKINKYNMNALYKILHDDKEELKEHIKALKKIFLYALDELEVTDVKDNR